MWARPGILMLLWISVTPPIRGDDPRPVRPIFTPQSAAERTSLHCLFPKNSNRPPRVRCVRAPRADPLIVLDDGRVTVYGQTDPRRSSFGFNGDVRLQLSEPLPESECVVCRRQVELGAAEYCLSCPDGHTPSEEAPEDSPSRPRFLSGGVRVVDGASTLFCQFRAPVDNVTVRTAWLQPGCRPFASTGRDPLVGCESAPSYRVPQLMGGVVETRVRLGWSDMCRVCLAATDTHTTVGYVCADPNFLWVVLQGVPRMLRWGGIFLLAAIGCYLLVLILPRRALCFRPALRLLAAC